MRNGKNFKLAVFLLSFSALSHGVSIGAELETPPLRQELDIAGRWQLLPKGPEHAMAVLIFEKKDGQWTGTWQVRDRAVPLADITVIEDGLRFRITAQDNAWFVGRLDPNGDIAGEISTMAGTRLAVAKRVSRQAAPPPPPP